MVRGQRGKKTTKGNVQDAKQIQIPGSKNKTKKNKRLAKEITGHGGWAPRRIAGDELKGRQRERRYL